jgi:ABC-2 type transport system ATP-binding protein
VALACALVSDPDLLFLDEPTTGLDPQARRKVWDVVSEYKRGGGTVLITSHYMEECERLCDRVAIMDQGKRIALGTPDELVQDLNAQQVVEFQLRRLSDGGGPLGEPAPPAVAQAFATEGLSFRAGWWRLHSDSVARTLPRLLEVARQGDSEVMALRTHEPTLEDVFLSLTGKSLRDD